MLRARAIENLSYVIASAQTGTHYLGRQTFGHSHIISPWGEVLATVEDGPGVAVADIDLAQLERYRQMLPVLEHRRL